MTLVAGVDSSTQSTKVVVCDAATGAVVRSGSAAHPEGTQVDPQAWWQALEKAADGLLEGVVALSVAGQQHGMVALDDAARPVRPALLWNDTRSAPDALDLVAELGGPAAWADATGSVPVASFTVTKLRWLARAEPDNASRVAQVMLPHDWLTARLAGTPESAWTDRGDASGTGYFSPAAGAWRPELLRRALGHDAALPQVAAPGQVVATAAHLLPGALLAAGTGDNMAAGLGLGAVEGDVVVSLGTSGTAFAVSAQPTADPSGQVAGFADATGRFLPLVCTLNAARVLTTLAGLLGVTPEGFDALALQAPPGAGGLTLLPYLDGERTPDLPVARGLLAGLTRQTATPAYLARAGVEAVLCSMAMGLDALRAQGVPLRRVLLVGGGARSAAVRRLAPAVLGLPVLLPDDGVEWVAVGAARQAAWAWSGAVDPPDWDVRAEPAPEADPSPAVLAAHRQLLADVEPALRRPARS